MGRKKYPDVFDDLPQEASNTQNDSQDIHDEPQSDNVDVESQDEVANYADINLTLKENVSLFYGVAKNRIVIDNQNVINRNLKTLVKNQVILQEQMEGFGLSEAKQTEVQDKFDEMAIRSANKFVNAIRDMCDQNIKRIESSDQVFIIPPMAAWCLFIIFFSLVAFFGLIVVTNALIWDSHMIWQMISIISGFAIAAVSAIILAYKCLIKK